MKIYSMFICWRKRPRTCGPRPSTSKAGSDVPYPCDKCDRHNAVSCHSLQWK